jgi:hypothetical protein
MPVPNKRMLHPLLLERNYWRNRLEELRLARQSVLLIPRPELSSALVEVDEFRIRAHDGIRLFGLRAKCRLGNARHSASVRIVGPSDLPEIDCSALDRDDAEFVFQEPAGRKLEDRVLDVLRVCQLAAETDESDPRRVRLAADDGHEPDEFLIATQLLADENESSRQAPLDDASGFGAAS